MRARSASAAAATPGPARQPRAATLVTMPWVADRAKIISVAGQAKSRAAYDGLAAALEKQFVGGVPREDFVFDV